MKRTRINFLVDLLGFLFLLALVATGLLIRFTLPPKSGHSGLTVWNMDRHEWGDIHLFTSLALFAIVILHLVLHWGWVESVLFARRSQRWRLGLGVGTLAAVALAAATPFLLTAQQTRPISHEHDPENACESSDPGESMGETHPGTRNALHARGTGIGKVGYSETRPGTFHLSGRTSLADFEKQTGIKVEAALRALNLPLDTARDERFGRLGRRHGFTMQRVRVAMSPLMEASERVAEP